MTKELESMEEWQYAIKHSAEDESYWLCPQHGKIPNKARRHVYDTGENFCDRCNSPLKHVIASTTPLNDDPCCVICGATIVTAAEAFVHFEVHGAPMGHPLKYVPTASLRSIANVLDRYCCLFEGTGDGRIDDRELQVLLRGGQHTDDGFFVEPEWCDAAIKAAKELRELRREKANRAAWQLFWKNNGRPVDSV